MSIEMERDRLVAESLADPMVTHIFFIDTDAFPECGNINEALRSLLKLNLPIVSGHMRIKNKNLDCTMFYRDNIGWKYINKWEKGTKLLKVDGCGAGCFLIKREVFEKIGRPWFRMEADSICETEDLAFCERAKASGFKVYVDLTTKFIHSGRFKLWADGRITSVFEDMESKEEKPVPKRTNKPIKHKR
jgi:GT2 family glycosyltransferase